MSVTKGTQVSCNVSTRGNNTIMCRLLVSAIVVCYSFVFLAVAGIDPKCVLDESKPAFHPGNYMDCASNSYFNEDESTCCDVEGTKVCCNKDKRWNKVKLIAIGIGCTTVALGMLLFIVLWCNVESKPCGEAKLFFSGNCCCCGAGQQPDLPTRGATEESPGDAITQCKCPQMTMLTIPVIRIDTCSDLYDKG